MSPVALVKGASAAILISALAALAGALAVGFMPRAIEALLARVNPPPDGE